MTTLSKDLIVFGEDWGRHPSSTQHLVRRLAGQANVLWVNSIGLRRPRLTLKDMARGVDKARKMLRRHKGGSQPIQSATPFPQVDPVNLPWPGNPVAGWINGHLLGKRVGDAALAAGLKRPILWTSLPSAVDVLGRLDEAAVVYYAGDDFGALAGVDHDAVEIQEARLAARADLIIAASPAIAAKFDPNKTRVLPHGIDQQFLENVASRPRDLPSGPVAGFYGSLSEWLDQELLAETAERMPDWTFVLIGEERCDLSKLKAKTNIRFLGPKAHKDLAAYAGHWNVSLMPFRDTAQIRACNPLKLREYLASGRPVVTTDFPALEGYRRHLRVAHTSEDWAAAIAQARNENPENRRERREAVRLETWDKRAEVLAQWLSEL